MTALNCCQNRLVNSQIYSMQPLIQQMCSFPFKLQHKIRNDLHSCGTDNNIYMQLCLRTILNLLPLSSHCPKRSGPLDISENFAVLHYTNDIMLSRQEKKEVTSILQASVRHTSQKGEGKPYKDSGTGHFSEIWGYLESVECQDIPFKVKDKLWQLASSNTKNEIQCLINLLTLQATYHVYN